MQLVEKDLVSLDDDVRPRVPELGDMKILRGFHNGVPHLVENTKPITLRSVVSIVLSTCLIRTRTDSPGFAVTSSLTPSDWDMI
jgi:hypothetical protein